MYNIYIKIGNNICIYIYIYIYTYIIFLILSKGERKQIRGTTSKIFR